MVLFHSSNGDFWLRVWRKLSENLMVTMRDWLTDMEYLFHIWSRIYFPSHKISSALLLDLLYLTRSNMTGAFSECTPGFDRDLCCSFSFFYVGYCCEFCLFLSCFPSDFVVIYCFYCIWSRGTVQQHDLLFIANSVIGDWNRITRS